MQIMRSYACILVTSETSNVHASWKNPERIRKRHVRKGRTINGFVFIVNCQNWV